MTELRAIASRIEAEMKGKDVEAVVRKVRREIEARVREKYPDLLA